MLFFTETLASRATVEEREQAMRLLTIAWTLVAVTWYCCDSAYIPYPSALVRNADWYDSEIQDVELLDVSTYSDLCLLGYSTSPAKATNSVLNKIQLTFYFL